MTARLIDGKVMSAAVREKVAKQAAALNTAHGVVPGLTVVIVGEDAASQVYVRNKGKAANEAGFKSEEFRLPADASEADLLDTVARLNSDPAVHGILVQLPLPEHMNALKVIDAIDPVKDVDGFHVINAGRLAVGLPALTSCTPRGCLIMLHETLGTDLSGMEAVVVGRSNIVGKPMAQLLLQENCTVTLAHSRTRDLAAVCRRADILVAAVGRPQMVRGDWIKPGASVIDVGMNRIPREDGKMRLVGDVHFEEAMEVAGAVTPVPGGVGLMTVACLLANTITALCRQMGIDEPEV